MTTSPTASGATLERLIESTPKNPEIHELVAAETPREQVPFVNDHFTPGPWPQDGDPIQSSPQHSMVVMTDRMQASPKDADYQTALTVLLSLGNDEPPQILHSPSHERVAALHPPLVSSPSSAGASATGTISQETILQLLRQYRYQVAPWLDICDMSQCFGLVVPRLAMESGSALHSLLALSSQSLQAGRLTQTNDHSLHITADTGFMQNQVFESVNDSELIHLALASTTQFLRDAPGSWHSTTCLLADGAHSKELAQTPSKLRLSVLGLLLRLGQFAFVCPTESLQLMMLPTRPWQSPRQWHECVDSGSARLSSNPPRVANIGYCRHCVSVRERISFVVRPSCQLWRL